MSEETPVIPLLTPYKMGPFNLSHRYIFKLLTLTFNPVKLN